MAYFNNRGTALTKDRYGNLVPLRSKRGRKITAQSIQVIIVARKPIAKKSYKSKRFTGRRRSW